jgi:hypothetical protein
LIKFKNKKSDALCIKNF